MNALEMNASLSPALLPAPSGGATIKAGFAANT
jgi:hypothetical protein